MKCTFSKFNEILEEITDITDVTTNGDNHLIRVKISCCAFN